MNNYFNLLSANPTKWSNKLKQFENLKISVENKCNSYEKTKAVTQAYTSNRECSKQEMFTIVYQSFRWERPASAKFMLTLILQRTVFNILRSQQEIIELPDENEHIFTKNMFDWYMDRPDEVSK